MSLLENIMDAEETLCWVEHQSFTTTKWVKKEKWKDNKAREVSDSEHSTLDSSTEATEPDGELERGTIMLDCADHQMSSRGPSQTLLSMTTVHHKGLSHPPGCSIIKGPPTKIQ